MTVLLCFASQLVSASSFLTGHQPLGSGRLAQNNGSFSSIDKVFETKTEETFAQIQAFLAGFRYQLTIPTSMNCTIYLNSSFNEFNHTQTEWDVDVNTTTKDKIFDTAHWVSYNIAPSSRYCAMTFIDGYLYYVKQAEAFGNFTNWLPSALQNLLANVITA